MQIPSLSQNLVHQRRHVGNVDKALCFCFAAAGYGVYCCCYRFFLGRFFGVTCLKTSFSVPVAEVVRVSVLTPRV